MHSPIRLESENSGLSVGRIRGYSVSAPASSAYRSRKDASVLVGGENSAKYDTIGLVLDTYYRSSILLLEIPAQGGDE